jgi:hypothetical protein
MRYGKDKGAQRYKCKSCGKTFTEFTGTWMAGLHRKDKIEQYLHLMVEEKSLDKIKDILEINKKTAFDWRHKILASLAETDKAGFEGITESDETFFLRSEKGREVAGRSARKRGGKSSKRGISNDQVAVIITQDRGLGLGLKRSTLGRIKKVDIQSAMGERLSPDKSILCTDAHASYKGFASDRRLEHHMVKGSAGQHVKSGLYHLQHVNSTHNKLKKWISYTFWGVSTKYLQQYLHWYRVKESIKDKNNKVELLLERIIKDNGAYARYQKIESKYKSFTNA